MAPKLVLLETFLENCSGGGPGVSFGSILVCFGEPFGWFLEIILRGFARYICVFWKYFERLSVFGNTGLLCLKYCVANTGLL